MPGRRIRVPPPRPRTRSRNYDSNNTALQEEEAEVHATAYNKLRADIYVPPPLEKGLQGRDGVLEYNPYSPNLVLDSKVRYWPQSNSNHHPVVDNQDSLDSAYPSGFNAAVAKKTRKQNGERIDRSASRRPRGGGLRYSESSEDERYNPEYREMERIDASASYLQNPSTAGYESYLRTDGTGTSSALESGDEYNPSFTKKEHHRLGFLSKSESMSATFETADTIRDVGSDGGDSFFRSTQNTAFCTIAVTSIQLLVLMLQLAMCGVASLDVNPTIGPFPDAFSQWGGKNPYLLLRENQWWRLVTPAFLHVGVLHLAVNVYCQMTASSMFEREWGWFKWLVIYTCSEIGCSTFSNLFDPDSIAVGSTGALMGLFAAKLSQVVTFSLFETKAEYEDAIQFDQLSTILCGLTLASLLGALTYIDFSGNLGGLVAGFFAGIVVFSSSIKGCCLGFLWTILGLIGLVASYLFTLYFFIETVEPDEQLANVCEYFRSFFPEGYECGCLWN
jgi:membrane associated rhomboid family serine protease